MSKKTIIISAFPACGKTWIFNNTSKQVLDSDSSGFSWIVDSAGNKERNPDFPNNYIKHIKENLGKVDIIFVSSHLVVRQALTDAGINYVSVYPDSSLKEEWIGRCYCRGNDISFLEFLNNSWDKFMKWIYEEPHGDKLYRLSAGQHLSDIISNIENDWLTTIVSKSTSTASKELIISDS